jgi:hypothetical protein
MQVMTVNSDPEATMRERNKLSLPPNFARRLLWSLPLMAVAGFCLFGFVATFEPMPRIERLVRQAWYLGAGGGAIVMICRLWLATRRPVER